MHDDVIKWKYFQRYWAFVRGIHRSSVNSSYKGQWRGALVFSLICAWINGWINNREAGDLRRHRTNYDVTVMWIQQEGEVSELNIFRITVKVRCVNLVGCTYHFNGYKIPWLKCIKFQFYFALSLELQQDVIAIFITRVSEVIMFSPCVFVCLSRCLSGRFNYEGLVPHKQYFAGTLLGMSSCASYVSRTHDVIDDVTMSQSRSNFESGISPSIFELERWSKAQNIGNAHGYISGLFNFRYNFR